MAFDYFARSAEDIAIVETGLGGRLDSTNIITPLLSVITNIGYDHMNMLGDTLPEIAAEKAGIIKPDVSVVVSERQAEVSAVFEQVAEERKSPLVYASDMYHTIATERASGYLAVRLTGPQSGREEEYRLDLKGSYQGRNLPGVLVAVSELRKQGYTITDRDVKTALEQVQHLTGLRGRWEVLADKPLVICDTGHNEAGWREVLANI